MLKYIIETGRFENFIIIRIVIIFSLFLYHILNPPAKEGFFCVAYTIEVTALKVNGTGCMNLTGKIQFYEFEPAVFGRKQ